MAGQIHAACRQAPSRRAPVDDRRRTRLPPIRLAVYTDYEYHRVDGGVYAERAFALFIARVGAHFESLTVIGRLDESPSDARYSIGEETRFVSLPFYESLSRPLAVARVATTVFRTFWRTLADVDCVWMLGPHPFAIPFALLAAARRKRVVLGVRQDTVAYVKSRHPTNRAFHLVARLLDGAFRLLGRRMPVVAVGPQIARHYDGSAAVLEISVSLVEEADIIPPDEALARDYSGELTALSVGRLEEEKNPLLLAEALRLLVDRDPRWRLIVCGEGPMEAALLERVGELGLEEHFSLRGYVPLHEGLMDVYRSSHALLHVSRTEGLPQVLLESFAAGLPVVATDVGGIAEAVGDAALLMPPDDAGAIADRLTTVADDEETRARLVRAGHDYVAARTVAVETGRVADFLRG